MNDTVSIDGLEFYVHPISTSYKTIAGLYVFMRSTIGKCGANWEILYIGEAEDLDARVGVGLKQFGYTLYGQRVSYQSWPWWKLQRLQSRCC